VLAAVAPMKALDRYVGRIALGAFLATLLFFLMLTIVGDLLNNLPRYLERAAEQVPEGDQAAGETSADTPVRRGLSGLEFTLALLRHYVRMVPELLVSVAPFATVIAGMLTVARLQHANEVVPMLFVGRSVQRVLRPILWLAALVALAMVACWQWVVPQVGASLAGDDGPFRRGPPLLKSLVYERQEIERHQFYARQYNPEARTLKDVRLLVQGVLAADTTHTQAASATWDAQRGDWRLQGGRLRSMAGERSVEWLVLLQEGRETVDAEVLSYTDLLALAEKRPNRADVKFALHRHITFPLANLLLLLLALPLAVFYERGSRISRVLGAIGLCGGYLLLSLICQSLGQSGLGLHPVVAAWIPTIVFGSLGIVSFSSMRT
jgi:lipopolysaccharide export system permease protein